MQEKPDMSTLEETNPNKRGGEPRMDPLDGSNASAHSLAGRRGTRLLETFVDAMSVSDALTKASNWTGQSRGRYICFCNVHSLVTATVRPDLAQMLNDADLVLPDGSPVAWTLRLLGFEAQKRVSGPDFMWEYCALVQERRKSIFLYGNRSATLDKLRSVMRDAFPNLHVAGWHSPPFRPLSAVEDEEVVKKINGSGADVVFVSLGCPKQEIWMAVHRTRINAVMLGVGAAFDYHAGSVRRAPPWVQDAGFEWLHRLIHEPRRLWKRYLIANSIFMWRASADVLNHARHHGWSSRRRIGTMSSQHLADEHDNIAASRADSLTTGETQ